ncbi:MULTISPECIES: GIY-YIG nuclease family protein [unclassified Clostridium]|uniref:GIY-YIG nuclease family protein n=1 Tax=unclassified Clostridium TaxID=2614128 RepID=UPI000298286B|nr:MULTISPECIES: GIY-YIG nuclease family protein [unclassified Clostridium]EKQ52202.1 MAG: putative endonuclease [Clostridium sp. Maddingley MBC34-26]
MNYVYIVECSDGTFYTGWTNNLEKRIEAHSKGIGAKYTKGRGPVKLIYHEIFADKKDAMRREFEIKKLAKKEKLLLVYGFRKEDKDK